MPVGAGAVRPESQPWRSNGAALSELGAAVAAQRPRFGDDQPMLHRRGMCRIAVAVAEVLVWDTAAAAAQGQPLLECLVGAASSRDRPTAAIAIEGLVPLIYDLRFGECRHLPPLLSQALLAPILMHAEYIDESATFEDEDIAEVYTDEEEWARVREQTLADAIQAVYESQRHNLLQHAAQAFEAAVAAGGWRAAEAALFIVGVTAPALLRRQLVRDPTRFLATPASRNEGLTPEGLAAEQEQGRALLQQLFTLSCGEVAAPLLAQAPLAAAAARLAAGYARWLAQEGSDELLVGVFRTVLNILKDAAEDPSACVGGAAPKARVTQATAALANLANRACGRLAPALEAQPALAAQLVAVCVALPDAVSNCGGTEGGAWSVDAACAAVLGATRLLAASPTSLAAGGAASALGGCWSSALGSALAMASGVGANEVRANPSRGHSLNDLDNSKNVAAVGGPGVSGGRRGGVAAVRSRLARARLHATGHRMRKGDAAGTFERP